MDTREVAHAFAKLCVEGKFDEAASQFWGDNVISREAMGGDMAVLQGRQAILQKHAWWADNHEEHGCQVDGPYIHGDQFALRFVLDVTPKGGERRKMDEVAVYTVLNGKIVEERFFYDTP